MRLNPGMHGRLIFSKDGGTEMYASNKSVLYVPTVKMCSHISCSHLTQTIHTHCTHTPATHLFLHTFTSQARTKTHSSATDTPHAPREIHAHTHECRENAPGQLPGHQQQHVGVQGQLLLSINIPVSGMWRTPAVSWTHISSAANGEKSPQARYGFILYLI